MVGKKISIEEVGEALSLASGLSRKDIDEFLEAFLLIGKAKQLLAELKEHHQQLSWGDGERCVGTIRKITRPLKDGSITEDMRIYHPAGKSCPRCGQFVSTKKIRRLEKTVARANWESAENAIANHKRLCEIDKLIHQTIDIIDMMEKGIPSQSLTSLKLILEQGRRLTLQKANGQFSINRGAVGSAGMPIANGNGVKALLIESAPVPKTKNGTGELERSLKKGRGKTV